MTEKSADGARLTDAAQDVHQPARAVPAEIAPTVTGESSRRSLPPGSDAQPRPGDRAGAAVHRRGDHRGGSVRQHRQRADHPAARVGDRGGVDRHDVRHHRRWHRPVGRGGGRVGVGLGDDVRNPIAGERRALADHGQHGVAGRHRGRPAERPDGRLRPDRAVHRDAGDDGGRPRARGDPGQPADPDHQGQRVPGLLRKRPVRHPGAGLGLRAGRGRRLDPVEPHHLRPPHLRGRRQPGGGPAGRHPGQAADDDALRLGRAVRRHRRR